MNIHQKFDPNPTEQALATAFAARRADLPGIGDGSLGDLRDEAMARFEVLGLPHRRIEAWHYTDLRRLLKDDVARDAGKSGIDPFKIEAHAVFAGMKPARVVFEGGRLRADLSDMGGLGEGVELAIMSSGTLPDWAKSEIANHRPDDENAVFDLATAMMSDGVLLRVAAGEHAARPIQIVNLSAGGGGFLRHVVVLEEGASARLIESVSGDGAMTLAASSYRIADKSRLDHVKVQDEGRETTHIAPMVAEVGTNAVFNTFTLTLGAALAREERLVKFAGESTHGSISGAFLLGGKTHADTTLKVTHAGVGGESREVFKGIVDDRAKSVVQNQVIVAPHAQKTDARQGVHVLLLSDEAEHNTKPELEIYADDVQCAHGATIGELDENALFYLMSRGVTRQVAESLLIEAFVSEAFDEIDDEEMREIVAGLSSNRLTAGRQHG